MKKIALYFVLLVVVLTAGAYAWATRHPEIQAIARPDPASFDAELIERGEMLAGLGNCGVCHTATGGRPYAGGLPLPTPFGVIHSTNITPDPETGIGTWSEQAFLRAMHQGIDREGRHLYPAFPYDFFAKVTEDDLRAIYAYLMTREPVVADAPENGLSFPFNIRPLLAGWNFLFLESGVFRPDPSRDEEWNRGAYIVEGLGHCGACHTPRNGFGAADKSGPRLFAGSRAEGWYVPPLNADAPAPIPWTQISLVNYLIDGWDEHHGIAAGPMTPVVNDIYDQPEDEAFAIAAYIMWVKGGELPSEEQSSTAQQRRSEAERLEWGHPQNPPIPDDLLLAAGASVFQKECAQCHKSGGQTVPLALTTTVNAPDPANLVRVTFEGIQPPLGALDRSMPARAIQIGDDEMIALAAFIRDRFSPGPPWTGIEEAVREGRAGLNHR